MRYKGYVVTYAGELQKVNRENYFMNGVFKEDIDALSYFDQNREFGSRNLYGISSAVKCDEAGEELAYVTVEVMKNFFGQDFNQEHRSYFDCANSSVTSHVFGKKGEHFEVDTSVLYIENDVATVYNMGDAPVFYFDGKEMKNLAGKVPTTVAVERKFRNDIGEVDSETLEKKTIPYLGFSDDELEVVPYSSEKIKLKKQGFFVLCSKAVADVVGKKKIVDILKDKKVKDSEKASQIVNAAIAKKPDGNYIVEIICVGRGLPVAESDARSLGVLLVVVAICVTLFLTGTFFIDSIVNFVEYCKNVVETIVADDDSEVELRWIPKETREDKEVIWDWDAEEKLDDDSFWDDDELLDEEKILENSQKRESEKVQHELVPDMTVEGKRSGNANGASPKKKTPSTPKPSTKANASSEAKPSTAPKRTTTPQTSPSSQNAPSSQTAPSPQVAPSQQSTPTPAPESRPEPVVKGANEAPIDFD